MPAAVKGAEQAGEAVEPGTGKAAIHPVVVILHFENGVPGLSGQMGQRMVGGDIGVIIDGSRGQGSAVDIVDPPVVDDRSHHIEFIAHRAGFGLRMQRAKQQPGPGNQKGERA